MSADCAMWWVCPWIGSGLRAGEGGYCMSLHLEILLLSQLLEYDNSVLSTWQSSTAFLPLYDFRRWKEVAGDPKSIVAERPACCTACLLDTGTWWHMKQNPEAEISSLDWRLDKYSSVIVRAKEALFSCSCLPCLVAGKAAVAGKSVRHWKQTLNNKFMEF